MSFAGDVENGWMCVGTRADSVDYERQLWRPAIEIRDEAADALRAFAHGRVVEGRRTGRKDGKVGKRTPEQILTNDYQGLVAEYAVCLYLDTAFQMRYDPMNEFADVEPDLQIRSTHHLHGGLIIRPHERHRHARHILVIVHRQHAAIVGWKHGRDVLDLSNAHEWWRPEGYWLVPQHDLEPMSKLDMPPRLAPRWPA